MTTCFLVSVSRFRGYETRPSDVFIGTPIFASLAAMNNLETFYIDDLESLGYILLYIVFKKHLPWEKLDFNEIIKQKQNITNIMNKNNINQTRKKIVKNYFKYLFI